MVLEALLNPAAAKKRPYETFLLGALYATMGMFLGYWVFKGFSSLIMVFLTTLAAVPLLYFTTRGEEEVDKELNTEYAILKEHSKVILFLMFLFLGMTFSFSIFYMFLPSDMVSTLFSSQSQTIDAINNHISGGYAQPDIFMRILLNNVRVLIFSILFSFLYGVGSIFILTWNSSVIATAIGNFGRKNLATYADAVGFEKLNTYFNIVSFGFLRYALHGIPEILAYFVGGLAGGIISMAIVKHDLLTEKKDRIISDALELILLSIGILVFAALLEVYVTPLLF